jgi:hypothetical protein
VSQTEAIKLQINDNNVNKTAPSTQLHAA